MDSSRALGRGRTARDTTEESEQGFSLECSLGQNHEQFLQLARCGWGKQGRKRDSSSSGDSEGTENDVTRTFEFESLFPSNKKGLRCAEWWQRVAVEYWDTYSKSSHENVVESVQMGSSSHPGQQSHADRDLITLALWPPHYSPTPKCPASWLSNLNPTSQFSVGMEIRHHSVFSDYSLL